MHVRLLIIFLPVAFGVIALHTIPLFALGGNNVLIAQVQAGAATAAPNGDAAATQEFISLYNNTNAPVDITGWCLSNKSGVSFACLSAPDATTTLTLPTHTYALIASDSFATRYSGTYDTVFTTTNRTSGSLVGGSDTVTLLDANATSVDSLSWTTSLAGGSVLTRQWSSQTAGTMLDTDAASDFKKLTSLSIPSSGVVEETHIVDVCANIDGTQPVVPEGYIRSGDGRCVIDVCPNLSDLQEMIPTAMKLVDGKCLYDLASLQVTELLPNASGTDTGNEYIELYNPNDTTVDLGLYRLQVGPNFEKTYAFSTGTTIAPKAYQAFYNNAIAFTLLNTSSRVRLVSVDGQIISEAPPYTDPADDEAWAFLSDSWLFTNQPTPGLANLLPVENTVKDGATDAVVSAGLKPCASNQYRNPETNRCRLIVAATTELAPCKDGQYRSEETNRCRNIASDAATLKPCADNQFRNPDTGRCKKIASEDQLADCGEGRERNPTTNRCRNVAAAASGTTGSGVKLVPAATATVFGWWAAAIIGFVAVGYAVLEWRHEIAGLLGRLYGRSIGRLIARFRPTV